MPGAKKSRVKKPPLEGQPEFNPFDVPAPVGSQLCKLAAQAYLSNMVSYLQQKTVTHIDTTVVTSFGELATLRVFLLGCNVNSPKNLM